MKFLKVTLLVVLGLTCAATQSQSRITIEQSYQELLERSDLVVIATPTTKTTDTKEVTYFPDMLHVDAEGRRTRVQATGVETRLECFAILKGNSELKHIVLHHYRETSPPRVEADGPLLVSFDPSDQTNYLIFLVRERDGRFAPTGGQTDPGRRSVTKLAD